MAIFSDDVEATSPLGWLQRNRGAVVITAAFLVVLAILAVLSTPSSHTVRVPWSFAGETHNGLTLHLVARGGGCEHGPIKARVDESATRVQVLLEIGESGRICPAIGLVAGVTVALKYPLGNRPLAGCETEHPDVAYPECSRLMATSPRFNSWPPPALSY